MDIMFEGKRMIFLKERESERQVTWSRCKRQVASVDLAVQEECLQVVLGRGEFIGEG